MKELFTYIMEFREGTYTSQVEAKNINDSIEFWINKIESDIDEIEHLGIKTIHEIKEELLNPNTDEKPIELKGMINTWYLTFHSKKGIGLIHIIKTVNI